MNEILTNKNNQEYGLEAKKGHFFEQKEKDIKVKYFSERAKKLVTAVYLVTSFIPANDPLRTKARENSVKLLSSLADVGGENGFLEVRNETHTLCSAIVDILEIALFSGYVSEMNFSVLKTEFDAFAGEILSYPGRQNTLISESLRPDQVLSAPVANPDISYVKKQDLPITKPIAVGSDHGIKKAGFDTRKTSRKEAILSIIRKRGSVSIKDISSVVIDCSEKTIQRELTSLVEAGVLKKTGERRWSLYSLV